MAAKLSFIAYHTRNLIKFGAVGLVIYTVLHILVVVGIRVWKATHPVLPPPPQPAFGMMPALVFPSQDPNLTFTYRLETATGSFPEIPDRANVYINHQYSPNLLAFNEAQAIAESIGFTGESTPTNPPLYRWRRAADMNGLLEMHIYLKTFDLLYDWQNNLALIDPLARPSEADVFNAAQAFMFASGIWTPEWENGQYALINYKLVNGQLVQVDRIPDADFIQINLRRAPLNGLDFVSADPRRPVVWALLAKKDLRIVEMHHHHQAIDDKAFSEYPTEPLNTAWSELISNKLYIASFGENQPGQEVVIRHFDLAYYQANKIQKFTQPIYVIRGDRGFVAYAPAVDRRLIQAP